MNDNRIHLIEKQGRFKPLGNLGFESGFWKVPRKTAAKLIGGSVYFHKEQIRPSFYGGTIVDFSESDSDEFPDRIIFEFKFTPGHRGVMAGEGGWGNEKKVVVHD